MRKSKTLTAAAILFAALLAAWYFLSPFLLLRSLSFAVRNDDRDTIAADVDFPAVRDGLKQQLDELCANPAPPQSTIAFSNLLLQLAPAIGNQVIDAIITPDGIATILRQHTTSQTSGGLVTALAVAWQLFLGEPGSSARHLCQYPSSRPAHCPGSGTPRPVRLAGHRADLADQGNRGK